MGILYSHMIHTYIRERCINSLHITYYILQRTFTDQIIVSRGTLQKQKYIGKRRRRIARLITGRHSFQQNPIRGEGLQYQYAHPDLEIDIKYKKKKIEIRLFSCYVEHLAKEVVGNFLWFIRCRKIKF